MEFPEFKNDEEMAEWFERNDVDAASLDTADDVVVAADLAVTLVAQVYALHQPGMTTSSNGASTVAEPRELVPA